MPLPIAIPIITAVGSMIGSVLSQRQASKTAKRNTDLTIQANKEQAQYQYEQEQKQIGELNKYNSPKSQMDRFVEAGLNKNLIYQQGSSGNQTMIPKYNAPNIQYAYEPKSDVGKAVTSGINAFQMATQIQNLVSQGKILKAEATLKQAVSKYAEDIAKGTARKVMNQGLAEQFKRVFQEEEFNRFFRYDKAQNLYFLKDGVEEVFLNNLTAKWLTPSTKLEETQANIDYKIAGTEVQKQMLKNMKFIPFLQPFLGFLKLLK